MVTATLRFLPEVYCAVDVRGDYALASFWLDDLPGSPSFNVLNPDDRVYISRSPTPPALSSSHRSGKTLDYPVGLEQCIAQKQAVILIGGDLPLGQ